MASQHRSQTCSHLTSFYSDLFENAHTGANAKEIANIITTDLMGLVNTRKLQESSKLTASHLKELADLISSGQVSRISSKNALHEIIKTGKDVSQIVSELDLGNVSGKVRAVGNCQTGHIRGITGAQRCKGQPSGRDELPGRHGNEEDKRKGRSQTDCQLDEKRDRCIVYTDLSLRDIEFIKVFSRIW